MEYGRIDGVDKPVSRIAQGSVMLSMAEQDDSLALLDAIYEQGCNFFDTSSIYSGGECDRILGLWTESRGIRDKVVILGKCAHHNRDRKRVTPWDITSDLHDTLARLRSDYLDLCVMHRDDPSRPVGPIVEIMNEHLQAGRIHAYGGSNWSHLRIQQANDYAESHGLVGFALSSPNFSLAERVVDPWGDSTCISGPENSDARAWYEATRMALVPWSSLAAGFFSGRYTRESLQELGDDHGDDTVKWFYNEANTQRLDRCGELAAEKGCTVAQIALAYLLRGPMNVFPLVGCDTPDEFRENAAALDVKLTGEERAYLDLSGGAR